MNSRGLSLLEMLIAVGIIALLLGGVGLLYEQLVSTQTQTVSRSDIEGLAHLMQDQLSNPVICSQALFTTSGAAKWLPPYGDVPISKIVMSVPTTAQNYNPRWRANTFSAGMNVAADNGTGNGASRVKLTKITLRQPSADPGKFEGQFLPATVRQASDIATPGSTSYQTLTVVPAKLQLDFSFQDAANSYAPAPPRSLDLMLKLDPNTGQIVSCYTPQDQPTQNTSCPSAEVPTLCPAAPPKCSQLQYVYGFTADGKPLCSCAIICQVPPAGPPGYYVPPPPPPASAGGGGGGGGCGGGMGGGGGSCNTTTGPTSSPSEGDDD